MTHYTCLVQSIFACNLGGEGKSERRSLFTGQVGRSQKKRLWALLGRLCYFFALDEDGLNTCYPHIATQLGTSC